MVLRRPLTPFATLLAMSASFSACGVPSVFLVREGGVTDANVSRDVVCPNCMRDATLDTSDATAPTDTVDTMNVSMDVVATPMDVSAVDTGVDMVVPVDACVCPAPRMCVAGVCPTGWRTLAPSPLTARRSVGYALSTERHELMIWGGFASGGTTPLSDGARYDWTTNTWTMMSASPLTGRSRPATVWTGSRLIIWSGSSNLGPVGEGAVYDPATDTWTRMSTVGAPSARASAAAAWTGTQMLVYGAEDGSTNGAAYNPTTDTWNPIPSPGPTAARAAIGWTGTQLFVWGGDAGAGARACTNALGTGSVLTPSSGWTATSAVGAPGQRFFAGLACVGDWFSAPWTGSEFFVWGAAAQTRRNDGALFRPDLNTWRPVASAPPPLSSGGYLSTLVWTGSNVLGWDVSEGTAGVDVVYTYTPSTNAWTVATPPGAPPAILGGAAFGWTGSELLVWGGRTNGVVSSDQGGAYLP